MRFEHVAVLMGGVSSEREVSLRSGAAIAQGLRETGRKVEEVDVQGADFELPAEVEAVFIALHGAFGEDGKIQTELIRRKMPYTGSNPKSCRLAFDKVLTRNCLKEHGIPVPEGEVLTPDSPHSLPLPVVVKPPREGSSVGCHLVTEEAQWPEALNDAARFSGEALAEKYIPGRELTVGILGNEVLPMVEIQTQRTWYDFEAKYVTGDTRYLVPAPLDEETKTLLQDLALKTFQALDAEGLGRVDFRLSPQGEPFVLELNSIPGFTQTSLLPKAAQAAGIGFSELCGRIMETAHL